MWNGRGCDRRPANPHQPDTLECRALPLLPPSETRLMSALYDEAIKLRNKGETEASLAKLEELVAIEPENPLVYSAMAVQLQKVGRDDEAIAAAKKVTELRPDDPFSFSQLSVICQRCGRIEEAETALAKGNGAPRPM